MYVGLLLFLSRGRKEENPVAKANLLGTERDEFTPGHVLCGRKLAMSEEEGKEMEREGVTSESGEETSQHKLGSFKRERCVFLALDHMLR